MKWIAVSESVPDFEHQIILLWDAKAETAIAGWPVLRHYLDGRSEFGIFMTPEGEANELGMRISHWAEFKAPNGDKP